MPGSGTFGANASCRGVHRSGRMLFLFGKGGATEHLELTTNMLHKLGLMIGDMFLFIGLWPFVWRQEAVRIWVAAP